jgi:hypothetical protein
MFFFFFFFAFTYVSMYPYMPVYIYVCVCVVNARIMSFTMLKGLKLSVSLMESSSRGVTCYVMKNG